nr:ABC transporter permease [Fredinandcohnia onubensis]
MRNLVEENLKRQPRNINLRNLALYLAFLGLFLLFTVTLSNVGSGFIEIGNLMNILRQTTLIAIMAIGMVFVLGAAQIDLSIGPVVGVTSLVTALIVQDFGIIAGVSAGLSVGVIAGTVNGILITWAKIPSFLATLGTMTIFAGIARTLTNLRAVPITDQTYINIFGGGQIGVVPVSLIWMIVILVFGYVLMYKTGFGRKVLSVGGNAAAAYYSGVNVERTKFKVMLISGILAAIAGILWAGRFGGGRYSLGEGAETSVIAAAVLGGTSIYGGRVSVIGAAVGAIMIGMIDNALVLYGLDVYQQMIVRGIVIVAAIALTTKRD